MIKYPCYCAGNNPSLEVSSPFIDAIATAAFALKHERVTIVLNDMWGCCHVLQNYCNIGLGIPAQARFSILWENNCSGGCDKVRREDEPVSVCDKGCHRGGLEECYEAEWLHYEYECLKKGGDADVWIYGGRDGLCHFLMGDLHYKVLTTFKERFLTPLHPCLWEKCKITKQKKSFHNWRERERERGFVPWMCMVHFICTNFKRSWTDKLSFL